MSLFQRLAGLETEYAIRVLNQSSIRPSRFRLYQSLVGAVGRRLPLVEAKHFKDGVFLANGGAIWFDCDRPCSGGGLIEGATPECRSPRELLVYQRAQDKLLREAAKAAPERFALLKNDRDASGNVYGAQENYECTIASGWRLAVWRLGIVLMIPFMLCWGAVFALTFALLFLYMLTASAFCTLCGLNNTRFSRLLLGADWSSEHATVEAGPAWLESATLFLSRVFTIPIALMLVALAQLVAFCKIRRQLTAFLVSRCVISGAGMIAGRNEFLLADKGPAVNCLLSIGRFVNDRPIYVLAHFFKTCYVEAFTSPNELLSLFRQRQRLQIGLGDSNMAETAEFLKLGSTMLVLDAIEAGYADSAPIFRHPLQALHAFCRDSGLKTKASCRREEDLSALETQRRYYDLCQRFVDALENPHPDAVHTLALWSEVLDQLEYKRDFQETPRELLGSLDWVTKEWLLQCASPADWAAAKKLDLRYAELTSEGYFDTFAAAGMAKRISSDEELERAARVPPPDSPATTRGRLIREFSGGYEIMSANWKTVSIGSGRWARTIKLSNYHRLPLNRSDGVQSDQVPHR